MKLWILAVVVAFVAWYVVVGRTWLKPKPWMAWAYQSRAGEWIERTFFKKSETILWARFQQVLGYGLAALSSFDGIDLTPLALVLPEKMTWAVHVMPLAIAFAGHVQVQLRMDTTTPIELINLPNDVPVAVAKATDKLEDTKLKAVAVVEKAVVEGKV